MQSLFSLINRMKLELHNNKYWVKPYLSGNEIIPFKIIQGSMTKYMKVYKNILNWYEN